MKNIRVFLSEKFQVLEVKFSIYLNRHVFVMHAAIPLVLYHTSIHSVLHCSPNCPPNLVGLYIHECQCCMQNLSGDAVMALV